MPRLQSPPSSHQDSPQADAALDATRPTAEQVALDDAWRAVDNAVRSIFELARSLEFLSDAIQRLEAEPMLEFREVENSRTRFSVEAP